MKIFDKVSHKDSQLSQDVAAVKLALQKLEPNLQSLHNQEVTDTEQSIQVSNRGLFEIKLDMTAVNAILLACGVDLQDLDTISIVFRAGKLADRNLTGQIGAGIRLDTDSGGHQIEVYTSLPHLSFQQESPETTLSQTKTLNFAFNREQLAITLLEELRHVIQDKLNLFDLSEGSFEAADVEALRKIDFEADAEKFTAALARHFVNFISIEPYSIPELAEMYVSDIDFDTYLPKGFQKFFDESLVAQVRETDPVGIYLLEDLKRVEPTSERSVRALLEKTMAAVDTRKLGFVEARWILSQLNEKVTAVGNVMSAFEVESGLQLLS